MWEAEGRWTPQDNHTLRMSELDGPWMSQIWLSLLVFKNTRGAGTGVWSHSESVTSRATLALPTTQPNFLGSPAPSTWTVVHFRCPATGVTTPLRLSHPTQRQDKGGQ